MRLLVPLLAIFLISFQQQMNETRATKAGLIENSTQTKADKPKQGEPKSSPIPIIGSLEIQKPTGQPKENDPYDPYEDTLYRWYLRGTLLGITGAVFGVVVLIRQTKALMDSERAWVLAIAVGNPQIPLYDPKNPGYTPGIVYLIEVSGKTPARIIRERFRCRIVPAIQGSQPLQPQLEKRPVYKSDSGMFEGAVMYASGYKYHLSVPLESGPMTATEFADLTNGRSVLCAYGCIEYRDAFKRKGKTQVCAIYHFSFGGVITSPNGIVLNPPGFRIGGPRVYNDVT